MHKQPLYSMNSFITVNGEGRAKNNAYIADGLENVGADIFDRGLCLPSDNKMTAEEQNFIIEVIRRCFEQGTGAEFKGFINDNESHWDTTEDEYPVLDGGRYLESPGKLYLSLR